MGYKENVVQRRIQPSSTNQVPILDEETGYIICNYLDRRKMQLLEIIVDFV